MRPQSPRSNSTHPHSAKTVVLAGSGHAHLEVIKALSKEEIAAHRFVLISPSRQSYYSGLIPRFLAGDINASDVTIGSADFAEGKGIHFIQDWVQSINQTDRTVLLAGGAKERFDLLSLNVGGVPQKIPSESPINTIYLRPFDEFMSRWRKIREDDSSYENSRFVVVGGGAAAVEVATALRVRLNRNQAKNSEVHLISKGPRLCEGYSPNISALIRRSLFEFNIGVKLNEPVNEISLSHIRLSSGENLEFDYVFVVTPTGPSAITSSKIDATLRIAPNIFAVGDCATMFDRPELPRSGVIAVHQGRHLTQSLRNILAGQPPLGFSIRPKQLNILISGENSARLVWGKLSFEGSLALRMKNWIDDRYMKSFSSDEVSSNGPVPR